MLGRSLKSGDSSYGRILIFVPDRAVGCFKRRQSPHEFEEFEYGRESGDVRWRWYTNTRAADSEMVMSRAPEETRSVTRRKTEGDDTILP